MWSIITPLVAVMAGLMYWLYWRWTHRRLLQLASTISGPRAWPFVGNAFIFFTNPDILKLIKGLFDEYGEYVRLWLGPELIVAVKNPGDIRLLLTSNKVNSKGPLYKYMLPFIGPGILSGGPTWRNHRKIATPSYNKKSVQHFMKVFNEEAAQLARVLGDKRPNTFDVFYDVLQCTTQSVCQTLMRLSKEDSCNLKHLQEVILNTQRMYKLIFDKMTRWWLQIPFIYWVSGAKGRERYFVKLVNEFTSDLVAKRRRALESEDPDEDTMGIVDRYIVSEELSEQEIRWETFTLFTTSQEASAKIASGVLMFLAHLPDWQDKVYKEILEVVREEPVQEHHLKQLHHLDMVYKETLRYFPIAGLIQRTVDEEVTINDGKITLPVGTSLVINIHGVHRDPKHWDEPLKVDPGRFQPEQVSKRDPNAFVPFSLGPMDCLGRVFATALIKTLVVHVVRRVQLEADGVLDDIPLEIAISVKSAHGYKLKAKPRKRNGFLKNND